MGNVRPLYAEGCLMISLFDCRHQPTVMLPNDLPQPGSYYAQVLRRVQGRTKLPWYRGPPSQMGDSPHQWVSDGLDAGTVFGPVHDFEETLSTAELGFISIKVPPPWSLLSESDRALMPQLIWINVSRNRWQYPWCRPVPPHIVYQWHCQGWQDNYYDSTGDDAH